MNVIEQFASSLAELRTEDIPAPVRRKLELHVVDTTGAWLAASRTPEGIALMSFRVRMRQQGDASSLLLDVPTNCALARLSEIDDIHLASMTTPGAIVIPGALTLLRTLPEADTSDLIAAMIAGYQAMVRLGLAIGGPAILYRGIWPTYVAAPFAVAAVAARMMRLDAPKTAHALALALTLAAPGVGHHNAATTARWLAIGNAARNGLTAALAARSGFTSDLALLESGFFPRVYTPDLVELTDGLGTRLMVDAVSFKPWCAARQTMAASQAMRAIIDSGVAPDAMTEIRVAVVPQHQAMIDHGVVAGDRASHLTSVQYQMAVAALQPATAIDLNPSSGGLSLELQSFMARIKAEGDAALLQFYPDAWPARLAVATRSGTHERTVINVPGDPSLPFDWIAIAEKFRRVVAPMLGGDEADHLARRIVDCLQQGRSLTWLVDEVDRICRAAISAG